MSETIRLSDILVRWEEARDGAMPIPPEELCRACPELLPELKRT